MRQKKRLLEKNMPTDLKDRCWEAKKLRTGKDSPEFARNKYNVR
jgi:hypothetical protein